MKFCRSNKVNRRMRAAKSAKRMILAAAILAMTGSATDTQAETPILPFPVPPQVQPQSLNLPVAPSVRIERRISDQDKTQPNVAGVRSEKTIVQSQVAGMLGLMNAAPSSAPVAEAGPIAPNTPHHFSVVAAAAIQEQDARPVGSGHARRTHTAGRSLTDPLPSAPSPDDAPVSEAREDNMETLAGGGTAGGSLMIDIPLPGLVDATPETCLPPPLEAMPQAPGIVDTPQPSQVDESNIQLPSITGHNSKSMKPLVVRTPQVVSRSKKLQLSIAEAASTPLAQTASSDQKSDPSAEQADSPDTEFRFSDAPETNPGSGKLAESGMAASVSSNKAMQVRIEGEAVSGPSLTGVVGAPVPTFEPEATDRGSESSKNVKNGAAKSTASLVQRRSRQSISLKTSDSNESDWNLSDSPVEDASVTETGLPVLSVATPANLEDRPALTKLPSASRTASNLSDQTIQTLPRSLPAESAPMSDSHASAEMRPQLVFESMIKGEAVVLSPQQSSSLTMTTAIVQCSAEHPTICKLIKTSDKSLSLIGLSDGKTRIAIVTADEQGKPVVEVREVQVGKTGQDDGSLRQLANEISKTIASLYPSSRIEIVAEGQQLFVQGRVSSESEARKVLSLVRKTALTPVIDRLQSSER